MRTIRRQAKATSLDHAIELAKRHAKERRLPSKVMADLMGVELKTYYRWLLDNTLPLNRIAQFEALTGSRFISEYLSVLHGDRVVIEIPRGRKTMPLSADKWDLIPLPDSINEHGQLDRLYRNTVSQPYDWFGAVGVVFKTRQRGDKWFCSEWCAAALGLLDGWRWSPNDLAAIVPALKRQV